MFFMYLKRVFGKQQKVQTMLPMLDEEGRIILDPGAIITTREKGLHS
jgi:hypothetical protein